MNGAVITIGLRPNELEAIIREYKELGVINLHGVLIKVGDKVYDKLNNVKGKVSIIGGNGDVGIYTDEDIYFNTKLHELVKLSANSDTINIDLGLDHGEFYDLLREDMKTNMTIEIKYFHDDLVRIEKFAKGDWVDLRSAETFEMKAGEFRLVPLGVAMRLPDGYEAHVVPRSSTFKNFGVIQTNGQGVIDNSYSGNDDQWFMPVYALRDTVFNFNDRICQFRIVERMSDDVEFEEVDFLEGDSRGGFGSTGVQ